MKVYKLIISTIISGIFLQGCSTGLHPQVIDKITAEKAFSAPIGEKRDNYGNLAIWMNIDTLKSDGTIENKWRWEKKEFEIVNSYLNSIKKEELIKSYFFIKSSELENESLDSAIKMAITKEADAIIIIRTIIEVDKYFNPAALLDLTIIGAYLIPGSNRDVMAKTRIEMINLRDKTLIYAAENTQTTKIMKPTFLIDTNEAVSEAKVKSVREAMRSLFSYIMRKQNMLQ